MKIEGTNKGGKKQQDYAGPEIDLFQSAHLVVKHKATFFVVFLFVFGVGLWCLFTSPEVYRTSFFLHFSGTGEASDGRDNCKSAKDLKGLIVNNSFNWALRERLNLDLKKIDWVFNVAILDKTSILQVSIDLGGKEKESGGIILQNLAEIISQDCAKNAEVEKARIAAKISFNENNIAGAKEKASDLRKRMNEIIYEENKLIEKKNFIDIDTTQILEKRQKFLKTNADTEDSTTLLLASQVESNANYLTWINKQLVKLSLSKSSLAVELEKVNSEIRNFQTEIDNLNSLVDYIPSVKILSQPKLSPMPVSSKKMKTLGLFTAMGLLSGVLAVFLQESRKGR
ncbi:MAG: hypothetical protein PHT50_00695 [Candidatus Omnitrophica bacterium]|nr:hypothetical protein [Candidatus Omnitrophota bacterium]